jgi:hypothetical protein
LDAGGLEYPMHGRGENRSARADDARIEAAVLRQLLALHPVHVTVEEAVREVAGDSKDFATRDAVERAIRELGAAGLVHRSGEIVLPSRAALRFHELFE